jgi:hypothetical protein
MLSNSEKYIKTYIKSVVINMIHVCPRCGFETNKKSTLKTHVFRKKPCSPTLDDLPISLLHKEFEEVENNKRHECKCGKKYASYSGFMYHKNICKQSNIEITSVVLEKFKEMQDEIDELKKMKQQPNVSTTNNNYTTNNNQNYNNTINQNIHIHLTDFGNENLSYLPPNFFRECLMNGALGVLQMIEKVWFDEEHPENYNIRLSSLKNMLVQYYKHPEWQVCGFHDAVDKMIRTSQNNIIVESKVKDMECTNSLITSLDSVQNLKPEVKRKIKDKCKGNLVNRRHTQAALQQASPQEPELLCQQTIP